MIVEGTDRHQRFVKIANIAKNEIYNVFYGIEKAGDIVFELCSDLNTAIVSFFVDASSFGDFNDEVCMNFLTYSLPVLVEVFLRRSTLRYIFCYCCIFNSHRFHF
jgi:hypothetical protein